jgi:hypothetical protein
VDILFSQGTQTGDGFQLGLTSQFQETGNSTMGEVKGNICMMHKQPPPELSYLRQTGPDSVVLTSGLRELKLRVRCCSGIALAQNDAGISFGVVDKTEYMPGRRIRIQGDTVSLLDSTGYVLYQKKYGHNIEQEVRETMKYNLAQPDAQMIAETRSKGYASVSNSRIFSASESFRESITSGKTHSEKQEVAEFFIANTEEYDCGKSKYNSHIAVSFMFHQNGIEDDAIAFQQKKPQQPPVQPPPVEPVIKHFEAIPDNITAGESSELSWEVSNADTITINPGIGISPIPAAGIREVKPAMTTTYTLTATNKRSSVPATATIQVQPSPPPPKEEVFQGNFSGACEYTDSDGECTWLYSFPSTMRLTLIPNNTGTISGTAECYTDPLVKLTTFYSEAHCNIGHFAPFYSSGDIWGTTKNLNGALNANAFPCTIEFYGTRSGNSIVCTITVATSFKLQNTTEDGHVTYDEFT